MGEPELIGASDSVLSVFVFTLLLCEGESDLRSCPMPATMLIPAVDSCITLLCKKFQVVQVCFYYCWRWIHILYFVAVTYDVVSVLHMHTQPIHHFY